MRKRVLIPVFVFTYLQALMTGTVLFQTFVMYPNIFRDVPGSLQLSMEFFKAVTPADFFPPFGAVIIFTGLVCLFVTFRQRRQFYIFAGSLLLMALGDAVLSIFYFWPLNTMLFVEGLSKHPAAELEQAAATFHRAHYGRLIASVGASVCAMYGLMKTVKTSQ